MLQLLDDGTGWGPLLAGGVIMSALRRVHWAVTLQLGLTCVSPVGAQQPSLNTQKNPLGPGSLCDRGFRSLNGKCVAIQIPPNAELNALSNGWTCRRGFQLVGDKCTAVQIPANAELDALGNGWTCKRGFQPVGDKCATVQIPTNAQLDALGSGWASKRGFQQVGDRCVAVQIPTNAQLDALGSGWTCKRGFQQVGEKCATVQIPTNAQLNAFGNDWVCSYGFKQAGNECLKMSPSELAEYNKTLAAIRAQRNRLLDRGFKYTTSKGADFYIRVTNASLTCREGFSDGYERCEIDVRYTVTTNYNGNTDPTVTARCEADVTYTATSGWTGSKSEDESKSVSVFGQYYSGEMDIDISFYEPAIRVKLSEVTCKIVDVY